MTGLTPRQQAFAQEFLVNLNATQAAIRAGYSPVSAKQMGTENLSKPSIRAAIAAGMAAREQQTGVTKARVVQMVLDAHAAAKADGAHGAVTQNIFLLARLHGHIVERRDVRVIRTFDDLSDDELASLEASARHTERRTG